MLRRGPASPRPPRQRLGMRQVYILPTRYGLLYLGVVLVMLLGAMNYMNNLAYLLTFLLFGLGVVAMLHTWRNLMGITVAGGRAEPVFAGEEAWFEIHFDNPGRLPKEALRILSGAATETTLDLPAAARGVARLRLPTARRGAIPLGPLTLSTVFPLGLFRAWGYLDPQLQVLAYPRPAGNAPLPLRQVTAHSEEGDCGSGADDYVGPRSYRPGDSPRHLDWKALARERGLLSKQFGGDCAQRVVLEWEQWPGVAPELRLGLLCRLVLLAAEQHRSFSLRLPDTALPEGRGEGHKRRCLEALALARVAP